MLNFVFAKVFKFFCKKIRSQGIFVSLQPDLLCFLVSNDSLAYFMRLSTF